VGEDDEGPGWLVGLILFLVFYSLASLAVTWVYCMYCRGGRLRAKSSPVISSGSSEEDIVEANGDLILEKKLASSTLSLNNKEGHMALASHGVT